MRVRICTLLWMLGIGLSVHGSFVVSFPVGNDTIVKQLCSYVSPGSAGNDVIWNFRNLTSISDCEVITSYPELSNFTTLCIREPRARFYWQMGTDTLTHIGYENAHVKINYTTPELLLKRNLLLYDTLRSNFVAKGEYCHRFPIHLTGTSLVVPDAGGTVLLGDDTIANTIRVHSIRQYDELLKINNVEEQRWQWFIEGFAYPIVDIVRSVRINRTNVSQDTTIYSATWVITPPTRHNKQNQNPIVDKTQISDSLLTQILCTPNPVSDNLTVSYFLVREASIEVVIYDPLGTKIYSYPKMTQSAGFYSHHISMSDYMTGTYVLRIVADDKIIQKVIIKR